MDATTCVRHHDAQAFRRRTNSHADGIAGGTSIQAIGKEVGEHLTELSRVPPRLLLRLYIHVQVDVYVGCTEGIKVENLADDNIRTKKAGRGILSIEAQRLAGDVGDSLQLAVGFCEVPADSWNVLFAAGEINEVYQTFQRIVHLMGNGGGQASCRCQLFCTHERLLSGIPFADVAEDQYDANHLRTLVKDGRGAIIDLELSLIFANKNSVVGEAYYLARTPDHLHRTFESSARALITD